MSAPTQQWPLHLGQGGVDVRLSRSRVPHEAKREETPETRPGLQGQPGKRQSRAQALCRRGPCRLPGRGEAGAARARSLARGRRGGAVARG
uniref:Coordinated expression to IRX2 n=1 Tax=Myotis myotis TaxID=51298 RepID=A0A7J7XXJ8_MYOMY|nr:coordinated expression to IRX2 [Myotis myotis]